MQLLNTVALLTPFLLASSLATPTSSSMKIARADTSKPSKPYLSPLFTADLKLGKALKPIDIPGGTRLIEPVTSGSISGPGLTATVTAGTAFPVFYNGMAIERPDIIVSGTTDKNGSFFATLVGVGSPVDQYVSINVDIGPPYANLNESFIIGEILRGSDGISVTVDAYLVEKEGK